MGLIEIISGWMGRKQKSKEKEPIVYSTEKTPMLDSLIDELQYNRQAPTSIQTRLKRVVGRAGQASAENLEKTIGFLEYQAEHGNWRKRTDVQEALGQLYTGLKEKGVDMATDNGLYANVKGIVSSKQTFYNRILDLQQLFEVQKNDDAGAAARQYVKSFLENNSNLKQRLELNAELRSAKERLEYTLNRSKQTKAPRKVGIKRLWKYAVTAAVTLSAIVCSNNAPKQEYIGNSKPSYSQQAASPTPTPIPVTKYSPRQQAPKNDEAAYRYFDVNEGDSLSRYLSSMFSGSSVDYKSALFDKKRFYDVLPAIQSDNPGMTDPDVILTGKKIKIRKNLDDYLQDAESGAAFASDLANSIQLSPDFIENKEHYEIPANQTLYPAPDQLESPANNTSNQVVIKKRGIVNLISNLDFSGFAGGDISAQGNGNFNGTYVGQGSVVYPIGNNNLLRAGVSFRPYKRDDGSFGLSRPFVTTGNFTHKNGDFTVQLGVPDLLLGNTAYNIIGLNPCGCSGNAPPNKTVSLAGLHLGNDLIETNGLGFAANYTSQSEGTSVTLGVVSVMQSDTFNRGDNVLYISGYNDLDTKTRLTGNAAVSDYLQSYNLGIQYQITGELQGRLNLGYQNGEPGRKQADLLWLFYASPKDTFSFGASYIDGKPKDSNSGHGALSWSRAIGKNWFLNARAATGFRYKPNFSLDLSLKF